MSKLRLIAAALACLALLTLGLYLGAGRWWGAAEVQRTPGVPAVLRVGYAVEAPYALIDAQGQVDGESPGLARLVVQQWPGVRIEWVQTNFDRLIPELLARRFDVIAAGLFITPERARRVRFSEPTVVVHPGLLMRADDALTAPTWAGLAAQDGLRVAVIDQAVEQAELRRRGVAAHRLLVVPDAATGRAALEAGTAAAPDRAPVWAPVVVATQARVALADEVGQLLGAELVLILLGERPGLSSPDSLGAYLTHTPRVGCHDAQRNCVSNIRPEGLPPADAAARLAWLILEALRRRLTGIGLKDDSALALLSP